MPIRNLIVLAPSGLVLFEKEYGKEKIAQPRLLGSLLTAMTEFATQTTAMRPSYIEMSSLAVTMCREDSVTCALVHDRTDKALFGRLLAGEILMAFVEEYGGPGRELSQNLKDFKGFGEKIAGVVQNTVQAVLHDLGTAACVLHTAVMGEDGYQMPYLHHDGRCEPDYISLLASSKYMFQACDLMLEYRRDGPARLMTFDDDMNETRTFLWRIEHVVFMVCVVKSKDRDILRECFREIVAAKGLIEQIMKQADQLRPPGDLRLRNQWC